MSHAPDVPTDERNAWDRRPGESGHAYHAFKAYLALGPERSLLKLACQIQKTRVLCGRWSASYDWVARSADYDTFVHRAEVERQAKVKAEFAEKWERRRQDALEANWQLASKLRAKVETMLAGMDPEGKPLAMTGKNVGNLTRLTEMIRQLEGGTIRDATTAADDGFDPLSATEAENRKFLERNGFKIEGG